MFAAAFLGDLGTYTITSAQLALAFPDPTSGFGGAFVTFASIFSITQIPLAVAEGLLTVLVVRLLVRITPDELRRLGVLRPATSTATAATTDTGGAAPAATTQGPEKEASA